VVACSHPISGFPRARRLASLSAFSDSAPVSVRAASSVSARIPVRPASALQNSFSAIPPDAPHGSFGLPTLSKYHPEERVPHFCSWVSTYHTHSNLARRTRNPTLLDTAPLLYPAPQCARSATLDVIAPASLEALSWPGPIQGSFHAIPLGVASEQTRRMLLNTDVGRVLPWCEVVVIWGETPRTPYGRL
jgi:hypothetical protein